jgi:hypothetical protein
MLISQTQAIEKIKAETGLVEADCLAIVKRLPKRSTGKREKVFCPTSKSDRSREPTDQSRRSQ